MVITSKSFGLCDSHVSNWKFSQISYSSQVRKELHCPKHRVKGHSLSTWQVKYGQISWEAEKVSGKKLLAPIYRKLMKSIVNKWTNNKCWWGCGEKGTVVCWWECSLVRSLWKTVWNLLRKLKMELPFDPAIPLLGLYHKNPETNSKEPVHPNVHSSTIHNSQVLEAT